MKNYIKNVLLYNISYKILFSLKPLRIRFAELDEFVRDYDGIGNLVLSGSEKYDVI